jgi:hypothetical protein
MTPPFPNSPSDSRRTNQAHQTAHPTQATHATHTTEYDESRNGSALASGARVRDPVRAGTTRVPARSRSSPLSPRLGVDASASGSASSLSQKTAGRSADRGAAAANADATTGVDSAAAGDVAAAGAGGGGGSAEASARNRATPEPVLENLALSAIEVIAGARDLEQLGRWVTREVYEHLSIRVSVASRARRVRGAAGKRPVILGTRVSAFRTGETIVDGVVTVTMRDRTRAVALRIEWERGRWRASAIHVL